MSKHLFSIYDKEQGVYDVPQFQDSSVAIMRGMMVFLAQNPDSALARFPDSFSIYLVGVFDEITGLVKSVPTPQFIEEVRNLMPKSKKEVLKNDQEKA